MIMKVIKNISLINTNDDFAFHDERKIFMFLKTIWFTAMWWPLGKISKKPLLLNIVRRSGVTGSQNLEVEEGGSSDIWSPLCSFLHVIELLYALGGCQERQLSLVPIYIGLVINCQKFIFNFLEKKTCNK